MYAACWDDRLKQTSAGKGFEASISSLEYFSILIRRGSELVLGRVVRLLGVWAVLSVVVLPPVDLAAQPFSKKIAVEAAKTGGPLGSASITIQKVGRATAVKLSAPTAIMANAFYLDSPARLVVDVSGCKTRRSEKFTLTSDPVVFGIRVGAHAEKLRMVVDLRSSKRPVFTVAVRGREVTLTIQDEVQPGEYAGREQVVVLPDVAPTIAAPAHVVIQPTPVVAALPTSTAVAVVATAVAVQTKVVSIKPTALPSTIPTALPSVKPTLKPVVSEDSSTAKQLGATPLAPTIVPAPAMRGAMAYLLTGYRFEYLEPGRVPVLKILLNKPRANAQISKIGPKAYKIVVPSCGIGGKGFDLPQFPPADFLGFVMIAAKTVEDKTEITISVEQGVTLGTFVRQNEIWVKRL